jgi:chemotaxis protein MotA
MKASTLIGILCGFFAIFGAFIWEGGTIGALIMLPAMLIVFGGTLAAGLAGSSMEQMAKMPKLFYITVNPTHYNIGEIINQIVEFSIIARKEGILALDSKLVLVKHPYLRKLFQLCIDGADPDMIVKIVETDSNYISQRHSENSNLFIMMCGYSPTMGIIGTVMGLIATLAAAGSDPNILIHHIASAFIATMWGIFMANIVWLPIGDKLRNLHEQEMKLIQVMLDGAYAVQLGEMPSVIRAKLLSAFPLSEQERLEKERVLQRTRKYQEIRIETEVQA